MSNYGDSTEDQLRYWRYNPSKPPSKYREDWERGIPHIPEVRDPLYIDMIDSVITMLPGAAQEKWSRVRAFLLEPGKPSKLRAAADEWDGAAGGGATLFRQITERKNDATAVSDAVNEAWQDLAAEALKDYLSNRDKDSFQPLMAAFTAMGRLLRTMADSYDEFYQALEDARDTSIVAASLATATALLTDGLGTPLVLGVASVFVSMAYDIWKEHDRFMAACLDSVNKIKVDLAALGRPHGTWPLPGGVIAGPSG